MLPHPPGRIDWRVRTESGRGVLTKSLRLCCRLFLISLIVTGSALSQRPTEYPGPCWDRPCLMRRRRSSRLSHLRRRHNRRQLRFKRRSENTPQTIEPYRQAQPLSAADKVVFSFTEVARPITLLPALYSASYEQLFNTDPKYGHDAGAFGEKFGASMLRSASVRVFSDGILAAAFHQDPRYYRIGRGSIIHRGLLSARQAIIRRGDDGTDQFNYSGIAGRAAAAAMVVTYYPEPSITARVVGLTFATSIATDAGGNLVLEFLPNIIRKFPIMQKLRLE